MSQIICEPVVCKSLSQLDCEVKRTLKSECCPVCTGQCLSLNGSIIHQSNERWLENDDCIECVCTNGTKVCHAESCEILTCENPIKIPGVCCRYCETPEKIQSIIKNIKQKKNIF